MAIDTAQWFIDNAHTTTTWTDTINIQRSQWYTSTAERERIFILILNSNMKNTYRYTFVTRDNIDMCIHIQGLQTNTRVLRFKSYLPNILGVQKNITKSYPNWFKGVMEGSITHNAKVHLM